METALFWIALGIISFWTLKTFYFSFSKDKFERLRKTALGINLSLFILLLLPWLPPELGGKSGIGLVIQGNILAILFLLLIVGSTASFLNKELKILKYGMIGPILNIFILFILMYQLRSNTFVLTLYDIVPILAAFLLLINCVVVLLLWQQVNLKTKKRKWKNLLGVCRYFVFRYFSPR